MTPNRSSSVRADADITAVGRAVAAANLVTAFGHVSRRTSATTYEITEVGDLGDLLPDQVVQVDIDAPALPGKAPGESWLHTEIYRTRADVGGIVRAQPVPTFAAASLTDTLRPLHGQAAWLGDAVPVFPVPRLVRSRRLGSAAAAALATGHALLLRANGAVCTGDTPGVAAARMWLLATACEVWLSARAAGTPVELDGDDVAAWASAGPPLLERLWQTMARQAS